MAFYKINLFIVLVLSTNLIFGLSMSVKSSSKDDSNLREMKPYSYSNYFNAKTNKDKDSAEQQQSTDNCEQVIKNGMICQVCQNPETNRQYEECSYASPSYNKSNGYSKFKKTTPDKYEKKNYHNLQSKKYQAMKRTDDDDAIENKKIDNYKQYYPGHLKYAKRHDSNNNNDDDDDDDDNDDNSKEKQSSQLDYIPESVRISNNMKKHKCKEIERDGMICMVCKDLKTGGNFEKCSFAHRPYEKIYKYSKSKSSGAPKDKKLKKKPIEMSQSLRRSANGELIRTDNHDDDDNDNDDDDDDDGGASEIAETKQADDKDCHNVIKDSMTCKVCVDPITKENSEQCSYSYSPDDKIYAYTHSSSYKSPKKYSTSKSDDE